jgi:uncharacterized protein
LSTKTNYEVPTWNQIYDMLLNQAHTIQSQKFKPDIIIGIARGGLVPACILTDLLGTPELTSIQIEFYTDINQKQIEPILKQKLATQLTGKKTLLVDDIADSGQSLRLAKIHLKQQNTLEIKTATLYQKPQSTVIPNFYEKQTTSWVVFPWDTKETLRRIAQNQKGKRELNQEVTKLVKAGLPKKLAEKLLKDLQ